MYEKSKIVDGDYKTVFEITGTKLLFKIFSKYKNCFKDILVIENYCLPIGII